jgi:TRAP transporter 4TM/12TM fusion protein
VFPVAGDKKKASKNAQEMKTVEDQKAKMTGGNESDEFEVVSEEQVKAVLAQYDRESNTREFTGIPKFIIRWMLVAFSIFAVLANIVFTLPEQIKRASFLGIVIFIAFLLFPASKKIKKRVNYVPWYDLALGIVGFCAFFYLVVNFRTIADRAGLFTQTDLVWGVIGILIVLEICRRAVGLPIVVVVSCFIAFAFYSGFSFKRIVTHLSYTLEGVIGIPLGVCTTFIVMFILFGAFLEKTGVGQFFIDISNSIAGFASGGPAKVAVIASAMEGMVSGSSVSNTVGSGSFTIPMMKKIGYKPEFAAAVEATASTGGQIMPPIMGAAAFLMAEITGIPYSNIVIAAFLPAALYFTGIFLMIHFEAKKLGLKGLSKEELPNFWKLFFTKGYLLIPLVVIIYLMMSGSTPTMAAFWSIVSAIAVSMVRKDTRLNFTKATDALENGARNTLGVAIACSAAGIIIGVVTLTGVGLELATGLLTLSGGIPILALFFTMIACIVLGMGVPTTANYVIMATITAPIVMKLGVSIMAAHMFVFYFGIVADITPPVALAAYAGSAIAHSNPLKTAITATRLAIAAFIIPYMFALNPAILLGPQSFATVASTFKVLFMILTSFVGMFSISVGMEGYLFKHMRFWERILAIGAGLLLIDPGLVTDIAGLSLIAFVIALQYFGSRSRNQPVAA